ncbi:hypothetical protein DFH09DRAFT_1470145 [Mycena vulgaris]|nr:hypothetical protein DFH09DRAFT_1470145 [Mycena vulgaris]
MSSASTSPSTPARNPLSDVFSAMEEDSPVAPSPTAAAHKRSHDAMGSNSDDEDDDAPAPVFVLPNQNTVKAIQRYAERKRLRADQSTEVNIFLQDPAAVRDAKILVNLFHVSNQLAKIVTAAPPYTVSPSLEKNLHNYAAAILLSSKISAYKGAVPTNILLNILKKHRFDLPVGIENNPADYAKLVAAVQDAYTQLRSKFKKALNASLKANKQDKALAPGPKHLNIFKLTQIFVEGTQCSVTVELCARVALMRKTFLVDSGSKFWDSLDASLAEIREKAGGKAKKIAKAFRHILEQDQELHGVKDYVITDSAIDTFQQDVDDLIDASATDMATSVAAPLPSAAAAAPAPASEPTPGSDV